MLNTNSGLPLGISESIFGETEIKLSSGDKLLFYSDGVTEAMNKSEEEFGTERLIELVRMKSLTVNDVINKVKEYTAGHPQSDDITVVMIEAE